MSTTDTSQPDPEEEAERWLDELVGQTLVSLALTEPNRALVLICGEQPCGPKEKRKSLELAGKRADPELWLDAGVLRSCCMAWGLTTMGCCIAVPHRQGVVVAGSALSEELSIPVLYTDDEGSVCSNYSMWIARELLAARKMTAVAVTSRNEAQDIDGGELWKRAAALADRSLRRVWGPLQGGCRSDCPACSPG